CRLDIRSERLGVEAPADCCTCAFTAGVVEIAVRAKMAMVRRHMIASLLAGGSSSRRPPGPFERRHSGQLSREIGLNDCKNLIVHSDFNEKTCWEDWGGKAKRPG